VTPYSSSTGFPSLFVAAACAAPAGKIFFAEPCRGAFGGRCSGHKRQPHFLRLRRQQG
jgi:hypothetical protein